MGGTVDNDSKICVEGAHVIHYVSGGNGYGI